MTSRGKKKGVEDTILELTGESSQTLQLLLFGREGRVGIGRGRSRVSSSPPTEESQKGKGGARVSSLPRILRQYLAVRSAV